MSWRWKLGLVIALIGVSPFACKKKKKRGDNAQIVPAGNVEMEITSKSLSDLGLSRKTNPIGALSFKFSGEKGQMSVCTTFLITESRVLTNYHCIFDEENGVEARSDQLVLTFKNPDSPQKSVKVHAIVASDGVTLGEKSILQHRDWALLAVDPKDVREFGTMDLSKDAISFDSYRKDAEVNFARINFINPDRFSRATTKAVVSPSIGKLDMSQYLSDSSLRIANYNQCKENFPNNSKEHNDCVDQYNEASAYSFVMNDVESVRVKDAKIRPGNSGSAVIMNGKVVGILHTGVIKPGEKQSQGDLSAGAFQLLSRFVGQLNK